MLVEPSSLTRQWQMQALDSVLAPAWEAWADAAASKAIVRQLLQRLQGEAVAAGFLAWAGAADDLRRRRGLAQRAAAWLRSRTLFAALNRWLIKAAAPAMEGEEDEEDPSQASTPVRNCDAKIISTFLQNLT